MRWVRVTTSYELGNTGGWTRVGDNFAVPNRFSATIHDLDFDVELDLVFEAGAARCAALRYRARPGGPLTSTSIRIPLDRAVRQAAAQAAVAIEEWMGPEFVAHVADDAERAAFSAQPRPARQRGVPLPDKLLKDAADVYRAARAQGLSTRRALEEEFHLKGGSAGRWVAEMRRRGLLGAAPAERRGGEMES